MVASRIRAWKRSNYQLFAGCICRQPVRDELPSGPQDFTGERLAVHGTCQHHGADQRRQQAHRLLARLASTFIFIGSRYGGAEHLNMVFDPKRGGGAALFRLPAQFPTQ